MAGGGGQRQQRSHFHGPLRQLQKFNYKLPKVFETDQIQWIPWMYAMWQVFRCNSLVLLVLSFLPFLVRIQETRSGKSFTGLLLSLPPFSSLVNCYKSFRSNTKPKKDADAGKRNDSSGKNKDENATENNTRQGSEQAHPPAPATDEAEAEAQHKEDTPKPTELEDPARRGAGPSTVKKEEEKKKKIVVLVPSSRKDFVRPSIMVNGNDVFKTEVQKIRKTFRVVGKEELKKNSIVLPRDWEVVECFKGFYFIRRRALDMMAKWILECDEDEENVEFVYWSDAGLVGELLTREEAYHKIFSEEYYVAGNSTFGKLSRYPGVTEMPCSIVPSWLRYVEMNKKWWGILSTIPTLLQAGAMLRFSTLLTFILIIIDSQRGWLNEAYERLFLWLRLRLKKTNPMSENYLFYFILSQLFSNRWLWYAEKRRRNDYIYLHHFSRISSLQDIEVFGRGYYEPSGSFLVRLWNDNAIGMELPENSPVAEARLRKSVFMEYFSTVDTLPMDSGLLRSLSWLKKKVLGLPQVLSFLKKDKKPREAEQKKEEKDKKPSAQEQKPSEEVAEQTPSAAEEVPHPPSPTKQEITEQKPAQQSWLSCIAMWLCLPCWLYSDRFGRIRKWVAFPKSDCFGKCPPKCLRITKLASYPKSDCFGKCLRRRGRSSQSVVTTQQEAAEAQPTPETEIGQQKTQSSSEPESAPAPKIETEQEKVESSQDENQPADDMFGLKMEADQEKVESEESSDEDTKQPSAAQSAQGIEADQEKVESAVHQPDQSSQSLKTDVTAAAVQPPENKEQPPVAQSARTENQTTVEIPQKEGNQEQENVAQLSQEEKEAVVAIVPSSQNKVADQGIGQSL